MESFEIQGLKEIEQALKDLPVQLQASVLRATNRKLIKKFTVDPLKELLNYSRRTERGITIVNDKSDPTAIFGGVMSDSFWLRFADR